MRSLNRIVMAAVMTIGAAGIAHSDAKLDPIVKQHLDSRGGYDRVSGLQRYEIKGTIVKNGRRMPMHVWWKYPNKLRMDVGTGDNLVTSVCDGSNALLVEPGPWGKEPCGMLPGVRELFLRQADFAGPFINPEKRGIKLAADQQVWGDAGYKVLVTRDNGESDEIFLDPNTRLTKSESIRVNRLGIEYKVEQRFSKYRRIEGFAFPSQIQRFVNGSPLDVIEIEDVIIGPAMDDSHFEVRPPQYGDVASSKLSDLNALTDLRDRFSADAGHVRLVAVLSPTSPDSRRGYLALQSALKNINDDRLKAYVVWTKVTDTDQRSAAAKRAMEFDDPRISCFWDPNSVAASSWRNVADPKQEVWHSYSLHGPEASWETVPPAPEFWLQEPEGGTTADSDGFERIGQMLTEMPADAKRGKGKQTGR